MTHDSEDPTIHDDSPKPSHREFFRTLTQHVGEHFNEPELLEQYDDQVNSGVPREYFLSLLLPANKIQEMFVHQFFTILDLCQKEREHYQQLAFKGEHSTSRKLVEGPTEYSFYEYNRVGEGLNTVPRNYRYFRQVRDLAQNSTNGKKDIKEYGNHPYPSKGWGILYTKHFNNFATLLGHLTNATTMQNNPLTTEDAYAWNGMNELYMTFRKTWDFTNKEFQS